MRPRRQTSRSRCLFFSRSPPASTACGWAMRTSYPCLFKPCASVCPTCPDPSTPIRVIDQLPIYQLTNFSSDKPCEYDVDLAGLAGGAVPLDEDRALIGTVDDRAASGGVAIRHEQADRALHAQEARRRERNRARRHTLPDRLAEPGPGAHGADG